MLKELRRKKQNLDYFVEKYEVSSNRVWELCSVLILQGYLIRNIGDLLILEKEPARGLSKHEYISRDDNTYVFGFIGDTHIGSKYCRYDVLNQLYDEFEEAEVDCIFHAGNWIEGESHFNKYDVDTYGMDNQCQRLVEEYPISNAITYAVSGDDHEGWYAQREGIDVGKHLQYMMQEAGRQDWIDLGYMEAFIPLINYNTGKERKLLLMHPGGGSAYATSYKPQKIVESFSGGEKPTILLIGHYHKLSYNFFRNVHCIQVGCTQDQTPFLRKKSIHADVGGGICKLKQDPESGVIVSCQVEFFTFLNKGYYNNRWNKAKNPQLPQRGLE